MVYTEEEKLAHVERAKVYVEKGEGSYTAYAREARVPRTTFHKWLHRVYPETRIKKAKASERSLVNLGKPGKDSTGRGTFLVEYYGSRIEVSSTGDLAELLKGIKEASSI
jgi:hypothetical protein